MRYKPNWDEAQERLSAMWEGRAAGRPCISITAPSGEAVPAPAAPEDPERKWLDPGWVLADMSAALANTWWGGEAVPSYLFMGGWAVCLGGRPRFAADTIWFETFETEPAGESPFRTTADDPWLRKYETLLCAAAEAAQWDDFLIGTPCILPANDLLSMHMGPEAFLLALVDAPRWMRDAIVLGAREQLTAWLRIMDRVKERARFWYGNGGWMPFWAPQPYASTQSDVSCMLSPEMFEEFVVPELDVFGGHFGAMWYHLDGADARQHLPRLLSLPYLRVIQYTPRPSEPPNGPAHLDFYRRIQSSGRIVHIEVPKGNVEPLVKALDPRLLMMHVGCESESEGRELLEAARLWTMPPRAVKGGGK